ncbi:hypothetical protein RND71_014599 [Anisodus tanguticus]|uniref:Uncharacterized protein n=1 Tax=Anisodus tanguticus TaxID=243964 RepID=A0AAE1S9F1_9SOLA|nr:hypothetical protein RND71_014599 [Anisodus tanguticus]
MGVKRTHFSRRFLVKSWDHTVLLPPELSNKAKKIEKKMRIKEHKTSLRGQRLTTGETGAGDCFNGKSGAVALDLEFFGPSHIFWRDRSEIERQHLSFSFVPWRKKKHRVTTGNGSEQFRAHWSWRERREIGGGGSPELARTKREGAHWL